MTKQSGKRAVIISNIKSDSIEQAIFILKTPQYEQSCAGGSIVAEAQQIINSYIMTMERVHPECRDERRKKRVISAVAGVFSVLLLTAVCILLKLS